MTTDEVRLYKNECQGSGKYPMEMTILDTVPGVRPLGTCPYCQKKVHLDITVLETHYLKLEEHDM